jgi:DNA replication protein DnaC
MNDERITQICKSLRLAYIADGYKSIEGFNEEFLLKLLEYELEQREINKVARLIKAAKFPNNKTIEEYRWHENIHLPSQTDKDELVNASFVSRNENIVLVGSPGTGKSHLAVGIGRKATENGVNVRFWRVSDLVEQLEIHLKSGRLSNFRRRFEKVELIILDEMGYIPFSKEGSELLFQLISDWYETKSLIITSNLEFSQWNRIFTDSRLTAALVDRLIHHAHILTFTGESYRLSNALSAK